MPELTKIVIHIDPNNEKFPVIVEYDAGKGLQKSFNLDITTEQAANHLFKKREQRIIPTKENDQIYCYNFKDKKINLISNINDNESYYYAGSNFEGTLTLIRHLKYYAGKMDILAPLYIEIQNKSFWLNETNIKRKKRIINEPLKSDFETYLDFIKEYNSIRDKIKITKESKK